MREPIFNWIKSGLIESTNTQQVLEVAGERPRASAWLIFIKQMMVLLGLLSLSFGVVFFFAYNWNELGRHYKFIILQVLLVAVFALYYFKAKSTWTAQALLLAGVLIFGALLALFGQTYQTGADPWQLFAIWALLISPLVLFSRSEVLWVFLAVLVNAALGLYLNVNRSLFGMTFMGHHLPWVYLLLNASLLLLIEWFSSHASNRIQVLKLPHRWAAQVLGLAVIYILSMVGMEAIWGRSDISSLNLLLFLGFMTVTFIFYRKFRKDLLLLTAWALAMIVFTLALLANAVFDNFDAGGLLLMAISLIAMSTLVVSWLKKTHESFKQEELS